VAASHCAAALRRCNTLRQEVRQIVASCVTDTVDWLAKVEGGVAARRSTGLARQPSDDPIVSPFLEGNPV